jgi:hypothetical protein
VQCRLARVLPQVLAPGRGLPFGRRNASEIHRIA